MDSKEENTSEEFVEDACPDHHYDFHILDWNTKNKKIITSFGMQHNDIPIHSELLKMEVDHDKNTTDAKLDDKLSFVVEEEKMKNILHANAEFVSKFISYVISHQCPRNERFLFEALKIQKRKRDEYIDDFEPYFKCIKQWVMQMLYKTDLKDEPPQCNKQLFIFQYIPENDQTDIHAYQLQDQLDKLLATNDKQTIELLNDLRGKDYEYSVPNKIKQLRKLLNKLQNITVNQNNIPKQLPLFVHHFYPECIQFSRNIFHILSENIMDFVLPSEVILIIVQFAITIDNSMYYDCWYLQHNAKKYSNTLVDLWDNLLFNKQHYTLTENKYNGLINNIWIPSQYLLKNTNNCLQNIVNEIRNNNILHIYRQITWSIFLQINSLNSLYNHDIKHISDNHDSKDDTDWTDNPSHVQFYQDKLCWEEWDNVEIEDGIYSCLNATAMYVFGGNIFNSIYATQRMLLVHEYDINGLLLERLVDIFKDKLDKRMKEIFPMIIPTEYELIDAWLNSVDDPPLIYEYFQEAHFFDALLKCFLLELMLLDGMDALVLAFAAFIQLRSTELLQLYANFAEENSDEQLLKQITKKLFAFKDVKAMAKLYVKYRNEIMDKCCDKIKLKSNPLVIPVDYRKSPPDKQQYRNNGKL